MQVFLTKHMRYEISNIYLVDECHISLSHLLLSHDTSVFDFFSFFLWKSCNKIFTMKKLQKGECMRTSKALQQRAPSTRWKENSRNIFETQLRFLDSTESLYRRRMFANAPIEACPGTMQSLVRVSVYFCYIQYEVYIKINVYCHGLVHLLKNAYSFWIILSITKVHLLILWKYL